MAHRCDDTAAALQNQMCSAMAAASSQQDQSLVLLIRDEMQQLGERMSTTRERIQLNLVHQAQLMQQMSAFRDKKLTTTLQAQIQQLCFEHQQLVQQLQSQQRHCLIQQGLGATLPAGLQSHLQQQMLQLQPMTTHPLYQHGMCFWPGCDMSCYSFPMFPQLITSAHTLNDRSTAQCRMQMQVVEQLEVQLTKERSRLQSMMQHLQMKQSPDTTTPVNGFVCSTCNFPSDDHPMESPMIASMMLGGNPGSYLACSGGSRTLIGVGGGGELLPPINTFAVAQQQQLQQQHVSNAGGSQTPMPSIGSVGSLMSPGRGQKSQIGLGSGDSATAQQQINNSVIRSTSSGGRGQQAPNAARRPKHVRRRVSDKDVLPISVYIARYREFHRSHDVRPPYTYAALIRQAIMEAKDSQLTLNELYNWFQDTFMYFRRNAATWKNAVRHNLSLQKCFIKGAKRANVSGAVWMVDDSEYFKRRPQRVSTTQAAELIADHQYAQVHGQRRPATPFQEMRAERLADGRQRRRVQQPEAAADEGCELQQADEEDSGDGSRDDAIARPSTSYQYTHKNSPNNML